MTDPYAQSRATAQAAAIAQWQVMVAEQIMGSPEDHAAMLCRAVLDALVESGHLLPDAHPITHGENYTWHYEDGHETTVWGDGPVNFPPPYSWEPTMSGHHMRITKVTRTRWHGGGSWQDEPEDISEYAKAHPDDPQWWRPKKVDSATENP